MWGFGRHGGEPIEFGRGLGVFEDIGKIDPRSEGESGEGLVVRRQGGGQG